MMRRLWRKVSKMLGAALPGNALRRFLLRRAGYRIGKDVYVGEGFLVVDELGKPGQVIIGDRVAIAARVTVVTVSHPNHSRLRELVGVQRGPVIIDDDAWIGAGAIILPGVTVGKKAIVGAGSIVKDDVAENAVVAGNPAKKIKTVTRKK